MERREVVVIGAGISGLSAAKAYLQCAPSSDLLVVDNNSSVGGTWAKERLYAGLQTNNLRGTLEYPDFPLHDGYGVKQDEHIPGGVLYRYLADYADHFGVSRHIRLRTTVLCATRIEDSASQYKWRLDLEHSVEVGGELTKSTLECEKLIVSTGLTSQPSNFSIKGDIDFDAPIQAFSQAVVRLQEFAHQDGARNITVVGGGKSAYDAVYQLARAGLHVNWIIRKSGYGPTVMAPAHLDLGPFKRTWLEPLTTTRFMTWMSPNVWQSNYPWAKWFLHRTWVGRSIVRFFWYMVNRDTIEQSGLGKDVALDILRPDASAMWYATSLAILNYPTNFHDLILTGQVKVYRQDLSHLSKHTVHLANGQQLASEAGLISTGWSHVPNLRFEPASIVGDLGIPGSEYTPSQRQFWNDFDKRADAFIHEEFPLLAEAPPAPGTRASADDAVKSYEKQYRLWRLMVPPVLAARGDRSLVFHGLYAYLLEISGLWTYAWLNNKIGIPQQTNLPFEAALSARFLTLRFPFGFGHSFPDFVFEGLGHMEMIMQDLGLSAYRKKTWIQEIVQAYAPADYRGVTEEWLRSQGRS